MVAIGSNDLWYNVIYFTDIFTPEGKCPSVPQNASEHFTSTHITILFHAVPADYYSPYPEGLSPFLKKKRDYFFFYFYFEVAKRFRCNV